MLYIEYTLLATVYLLVVSLLHVLCHKHYNVLLAEGEHAQSKATELLLQWNYCAILTRKYNTYKQVSDSFSLMSKFDVKVI